MFNIDVIQAEYGDCFLIELGDRLSNSHHILIDGGPSAIYKDHLRPSLEEICKNKILDLIVCTHIDIDHIGGLLGLFNDLSNSKGNNPVAILGVKNLWHNSFQELLGASATDIANINKFLASIEPLRYINSKPDTLSVMKAVGEGIDLGALAKKLSIPINTQFKDGSAAADKNTASIKIGGATLQMLGPSQKNVELLRKLWNDWVVKDKKKKVTYEQYTELVAIDSSVSNLSSIMFLMEYDGKKAIFTGDGLGSNIIEMLSLKGMLNKDGKIHVDVLKVPHHGSERNISNEFFEHITADTYIVSANGRDDNPSLSTLELIIENADKLGKRVEILATNRTPNIDKVILKYSEQKYNYEFRFLAIDENYLQLPLK